MARRKANEAGSTRHRKTPARAAAPKRSAADAGSAYQLKIQLNRTKPLIWRRVLTRDCTLATLHRIIQCVMPWDDCHMHVFRVGDREYGPEDQSAVDMMWGEPETDDEGEVMLSQLAGEGIKKIHYEYDFGDGWEHTISLEKIVPVVPGIHYPVCVAGERAGPPEDCGGVWGFYDMLEALRSPKTARHKEILEWIGGEFDAEEFNMQAINGCLARLRSGGARPGIERGDS
jgi:hypothetical protein